MKTFNEDIVCSHGDVPLSLINQLHRELFFFFLFFALCCMRHRQPMCV